MMRAPLGREHSLLWGHAIWDEERKEAEAEKLCRHFIDQKVAGAFFAPLEFTQHHDNVNNRILAAFEKAGIPVVLLDKDIVRFPNRSNYDLVTLDNRQAGYVITHHFIEQGCTRIAFFARERSAETVDTRIAGYKEALIAAGLLDGDRRVVRGDLADPAVVDRALKTTEAEAVVCANDFTAANLMQSLRLLGKSVPDDIRIAASTT